MRTLSKEFRTLAASLVAGVLLFGTQAALAQTASPPAATATRPAKTPDQTSVPGNGPPSTTGQTTGETSRDPTIKTMNDDEKQKVDTKGK